MTDDVVAELDAVLEKDGEYAYSVSDVRAQCRERYGDTPCILIVRSDGMPAEAHDCADWCPLLRRSIEDACHQMAMTTQRTLFP